MNNRVVCFTDSLGLGGAQRQLVGLATLLKNKGYQITVLLYHDIPFYKHILDENHIDSVVVSGSPFMRLWRLYRYLKKNPCDIVVAYQSAPSMIACLLRPFLSFKTLIVSERGTSEVISFKTKLLFKLWRFADYIVPNSYSQTYFIKQNAPQYIDKLVTITNFIDTDMFVPAPISKSYSETIKILSLGRITSQKNIIEYIKAIDIVSKKGYKIKILWYGNTDNAEYELQCRCLVKSYALEEIFEFLPAVNDVVPLYQQANVFCLPSLFEGFPNVVCEAMSCGLPILCSNICDNPLIVEDGGNGILFSPDCAENIADAIIKYINLSEGKKVQMGVRSRELALEKFSSEVFIQKYINLIES